MIVGWIMRLAPFGLAALLLQLVASQQGGLLQSLGHFIVVVTGTTLFHGLVVLPLILWLFTGMSPLNFWSGAREALITAFATSSSSATLPVTLRCVEQHLHVRKPDIAGFVVPLAPRSTWTVPRFTRLPPHSSSRASRASNSTSPAR